MIAETIALAEAVIAQHRGRLERQLQSNVTRVFLRQRRAFPSKRAAEAALYVSGVSMSEAAPPPPGVDPLWDVVVGAWPDEADALMGVIDAAAGRAAQMSADTMLAQLGLDGGWSMNADVADLLATQSLGAATSIDATSQQLIRDILARGVAQKDTAVQIARDIRAEFTDWSVARARMVSVTEIANAWESTAQDVMKSRGIQQRRWLTAGDDIVDGGHPNGPCQDNEDAGPVDMNDAFPSGDMHPPAHPSCRCTTAPVVD